jgi:hypothetical protein
MLQVLESTKYERTFNNLSFMKNKLQNQLIEYERTFNNLSFMENKLQNQLIIHLDLCVRMFSHNFKILSNFYYDEAIALWKEVAMKYK